LGAKRRVGRAASRTSEGRMEDPTKKGESHLGKGPAINHPQRFPSKKRGNGLLVGGSGRGERGGTAPDGRRSTTRTKENADVILKKEDTTSMKNQAGEGEKWGEGSKRHRPQSAADIRVCGGRGVKKSHVKPSGGGITAAARGTGVDPCGVKQVSGCIKKHKMRKSKKKSRTGENLEKCHCNDASAVILGKGVQKGIKKKSARKEKKKKTIRGGDLRREEVPTGRARKERKGGNVERKTPSRNSLTPLRKKK